MLRLTPIISCILAAVAVPLSSRHLSKTLGASRCKTADNHAAGSQEKIPNGLTIRRARASHCDTSQVQPGIRLTSFPNTGTTWIQYLLEEATKVATQNPQSVIVQAGRPYLFTGDVVSCRAECGAQLYLNESCHAGSFESHGVTLPQGDEPEVFKNHYPDFTDPYAMFETENMLPKTLLLVRNPIDAYLSQVRHIASNSDSKVGKDTDVNLGTYELNATTCPGGFTAMRPATANKAIDPLGITAADGIVPESYRQAIRQWGDFFGFWYGHPSVACTEIVVVRYEDLVGLQHDVLGMLLEETGIPSFQEGIARAMQAYPPDADRISYNVYFNRSLANNKTILDWAEFALTNFNSLVETFGYVTFLQDILERAADVP